MNNDNIKFSRSRLTRSDGTHKPTGSATVFFGQNYTAEILNSTTKELHYIDNYGAEKCIQFEKCDVNNPYIPEKYVGERGILDSPPWIKFFDINNTCFEFESQKDALSLVWDILAIKGIKTIDTN